jgi:hypothetical protein
MIYKQFAVCITQQTMGREEDVRPRKQTLVTCSGSSDERLNDCGRGAKARTLGMHDGLATCEGKLDKREAGRQRLEGRLESRRRELLEKCKEQTKVYL